MRSLRGNGHRAVLAAFVATTAVLAQPIGIASPVGAGAVAHAAEAHDFVAATATPDGAGVHRLDVLGGVHTSGGARFLGSLPERRAGGQPIADAAAVDIATTRSGDGYWIFDESGGVHTFGDARYHGSIPALRQSGVATGRARVVAAAVTRTGDGYWMLDGDGGIFAFGDATYLGSVPALRLAGLPIADADAVDFTPTPGGDGYLVLDSDGGIFTFGDAEFHGSLPALRQAGQSIGQADVRDVIMAADGVGYWVTDSVGGIFTFGAVDFHGSAPSRGIDFDLVSTAVLRDGSGYWMMDPAGELLAFGEAGSAPVAGPLGLASSHRFIQSNADGTPVRLNPCRTHEYVVHIGPGSPDNARDLARTAFAHLSSATGIRFRDAGTTGESYSPAIRPWHGHPRYGDTWAPILVSFEAPDGRNRIGDDGGKAASQLATNAAGRWVVASGAVGISTTKGLTADFRNGASYGAVLLHELAHVAGLHHVGDRTQLMDPILRPSGPALYQAGDLAGLERVGREAGCIADPVPA